MTVFHISKGTSGPLKSVFGGGEATEMTPKIASNIAALESVLFCWFEEESVETEVPLLGKSLDILAKAEVPPSGDEVSVAIENQYGLADADHFGRLLGWYMPETSAEMGVLIAESFDPHLVRAVYEGDIVRPKHGLWLVEATGQFVGGVAIVSYTLKATSLKREEFLGREKAFRTEKSGVSVNQSEKDILILESTESLFAHIARTGSGVVSSQVGNVKTISKWYRVIKRFDFDVHIAMFVGAHRVSIGLAYLKGNLDQDLLIELSEINREMELTPEPSKRELRSVWWNVANVGRADPQASWPADLGHQIDSAFELIESAIMDLREKIETKIRTSM